MSKLDDLLKVFRAGTKLAQEITVLEKQVCEKEEQFKLLIESIGDHLGLKDNDYINEYDIKRHWGLIQRTCESIEED